MGNFNIIWISNEVVPRGCGSNFLNKLTGILGEGQTEGLSKFFFAIEVI